MSRRTPLVCQYLERISRDALSDYQQLVRELVRGRHGVYALYRGLSLRYVGLASDLSTRLNAHLNDRHADSWDVFSVYLVIGDSHLKELESLILRIFRPKDNRQKGTFAKSENLAGRFRRRIREQQDREMDAIFGNAVRTRAPDLLATPKNGAVLSCYIRGGLKLRARHKGKLLTASVRRDGMIRFRGKSFKSPSGAGAAACGRSCDGWTFWSYERAPGDWVRLEVLRRASQRSRTAKRG